MLLVLPGWRRESVMHMLWEMDRWMSRWLNGAPPSTDESDADP